MERLTKWTGEEWIPTQERRNGKIIGYRACIKRLAAYEDTELTPEEVANLKTFDGSQAVKATMMLQEEQRKHRWIPVSERLPEYDKAVLVQWEDYNRLTGNADVYIDKMWRIDYKDGCAFESALGVPNGKVVAWMPLPEVYRPE